MFFEAVGYTGMVISGLWGLRIGMKAIGQFSPTLKNKLRDLFFPRNPDPFGYAHTHLEAQDDYFNIEPTLKEKCFNLLSAGMLLSAARECYTLGVSAGRDVSPYFCVPMLLVGAYSLSQHPQNTPDWNTIPGAPRSPRCTLL